MSSCPNLARKRGLCSTCERRYERSRGPRAQRGYDAVWRALSRRYLRAHPVCEDEEGCAAPSEHADHMVPLSQGGARLDWSNLRARCKPHHSKKTAGERSRDELGRWGP